MQTLTKEIIEHGLADRVILDSQLERLVSGSRQRRHHLVNRAMKSGELLRLCRGAYVLNSTFRDHPAHPFALAQAFIPGSYVSFETALAFHGWIPEAVRAVACVTPGRKSAAYEHPVLGSFHFYPLAIGSGCFLELVERRQSEKQAMLIAKPVRALLDLVCLRKIEWQGMGWLMEGMRIDHDRLRTINHADIQTLDRTYKQSRVKRFLKSLALELGNA